MSVPLHQQDERILKEHRPTDAVVALLLEVRHDLEQVRALIEGRNYGLADEAIDAAMRKLPETGDVHDPPWPQKRHFALASDFGFHPAYQPIYDAEMGRKEGSHA